MTAVLETISSRRRGTHSAAVSSSFLIEYGVKEGQLLLREGKDEIPVIGLYLSALHGRHNRRSDGGQQVDIELGWAEVRRLRVLSVREEGVQSGSGQPLARESRAQSSGGGDSEVSRLVSSIRTMHDSPTRRAQEPGFSVDPVDTLPPVARTVAGAPAALSPRGN